MKSIAQWLIKFFKRKTVNKLINSRELSDIIINKLTSRSKTPTKPKISCMLDKPLTINIYDDKGNLLMTREYDADNFTVKLDDNLRFVIYNRKDLTINQ